MCLYLKIEIDKLMLQYYYTRKSKATIFRVPNEGFFFFFITMYFLLNIVFQWTDMTKIYHVLSLACSLQWLPFIFLQYEEKNAYCGESKEISTKRKEMTNKRFKISPEWQLWFPDVLPKNQLQPLHPCNAILPLRSTYKTFFVGSFYRIYSCIMVEFGNIMFKVTDLLLSCNDHYWDLSQMSWLIG